MKRAVLFPWLEMLTSGPPKVGGQAIIEGVMMRGKSAYSMAVRKQSGEVICEKRPFVSLSKRLKGFGWPVLRGFVQLVESLVLGIKSLNYSAAIAAEDEQTQNGKAKKASRWDAVLGGAAIALSFAIAMGVFMYLPLLLSSLIQKDQNPLLFNAIAGTIRIVFFLVYLWLISMWKDIRRVFEYHGAEHMAIFTYEAGQDLSLANARTYHTHHPRCGTSFLLIVALVCIVLFAFFDGLVAMVWGPYPTVLHRFLVHFLLIPLVSGVSYEILKLSDKVKHNPVVAFLVKPGLWLQRITTRKPDDAQLEVAFTALRAVI